MVKAKARLMRVIITAQNIRLISQALREHPIDIGCTGGWSHEGGAVRVEAYVPERELEALKGKDLHVEVVGDATAAAAERRREVGRGNRFAGENPVPRGLGRKVKEARP